MTRVFFCCKFRFNQILKKKVSTVSEDFFKQKNLIYLFIDKSSLKDARTGLYEYRSSSNEKNKFY